VSWEPYSRSSGLEISKRPCTLNFVRTISIAWSKETLFRVSFNVGTMVVGSLFHGIK
jgi:hypothetical protein